MARRRKTIEELKESGTYRPSRHGAREVLPAVPLSPRKAKNPGRGPGWKSPEELTQKQAWDMVAGEVRAGRMPQPACCATCDRREKLWGHHYRGYRYPLDVWWVCSSCNRLLTVHDGTQTLEQARAEIAQAKGDPDSESSPVTADEVRMERDRLADLIGERLSVLDGTMLDDLAERVCEVRRLREAVRTATPGQMQHTRISSALNNARTALDRLASAFGMMPATRASLPEVAPNPPERATRLKVL